VALALNVVGPWGLFFAYQLNRCKEQIAEEMPIWLDVWYELEALAALANFAELHPSYCTPQIAGEKARPVFQGKGIGHPLLPDSVKVRNDFQIETLGEIVILTGSNMAGKSTFLRALGLNLVLAYTGSVVDAGAFTTVLFRLFTCIRVNDSVSDGISYFYAEVQRLGALLSALETPHSLPLFFCIDEIFRGTNNRERLIGSRAYLRALVGKQGAGLIATHDLELVKLADELPGVRNFHFRDDIDGGKMVFDYILRPGPSPTTNALKIMRSVGLPVEGDGM
jgi:DNA mismatch repair ATPase MutS